MDHTETYERPTPAVSLDLFYLHGRKAIIAQTAGRDGLAFIHAECSMSHYRDWLAWETRNDD